LPARYKTLRAGKNISCYGTTQKKKKVRKYKIGDMLVLKGTGDFFPGVECVIVEVSEDGKYPTKIRAVVPDEKLCRHGFIEEDGQYYAVEWKFSTN